MVNTVTTHFQVGRAARAVLGVAVALAPLTAAANAVLGQGTWQTTLQARDLNGDGMPEAFYDTMLNISWLADANAGSGSGYDATYGDGLMTWADAQQWVTGLNVLGRSGWRLPTVLDVGAAGCDTGFGGGTECGYNVLIASADGQTVYSEWAHLYYLTLGNLAYCPPLDDDCLAEQPGWGLANTAGFSNLMAGAYWSGTAYAPLPLDAAWAFSADDGRQFASAQAFYGFALAVRAGDVATAAAVPEPSATMLTLLALGALVWTRRRGHGPQRGSSAV